MNTTPEPPRAPQQPLLGGRDGYALRTRAQRRIDARMAAEQRLLGELPGPTPIETLPPPRFDAADAASAPARRPWLAAARDALARRSGRTPRP
jgi:hypothetical protein